MKIFIKLVAIVLLVSCNLKNNTEENKFFFQKGETFFKQYEYSKAIPYYQHCINITPDTDSLKLLSYFRLFYCHFRLENISLLDSLYRLIDHLYSNNSYHFKNELLRTRAYLMASRKDYPAAITLLKQVQHSSIQPNDYFRIAVYYDRQDKLDSAEHYFNYTLRYAQQINDTSNFIISSAYCNLANYAYYYKGDMEKAKALFDSAIWIMQYCHATDSDHYAWNIFSLGVFMQTSGHIRRAIEYYDQAYRVYAQLPGNHEAEISSILVSQATIDNYLQKYTIALNKVDKAINYFKDRKEPYYLTIAHTVRANILYSMREYRRALQEYQSLLNLYNTVQLLRKEELYYLIGRCYMNINHFDSANYWFQRSITHFTQHPTMLVNYCCTYSNFLLNAGNHRQALAVLEKNYPFIKKKFAGKNQQLIYFLNTRAKVLEKSGKYKESLATYNQIFELIMGESLASTSPLIVPILGKPDHELANEVITALQGKAELLSNMANNNTAYLQASLQHFQKAAEFAETYKRSIRLEMDKLLYNEFNTQISEKIFALAIQLWSLHDSPSLKNHYLQLAFNISNSLKANVLTENIIENSLKQLSGIPDSILNKEKNLMQDILILQNTIRDEYRQANPNLLLIQSWQKQLVSHLAALQELETKNEAMYPLYRELKYQHRKTFTIKELQHKLKPGENLLSYHWQNNQMFIFLLNKQSVQLFHIKDTSLNVRIEQFRNKLTHPSFEKNYARDFHEYVDLAYYLYHTLIAPTIPYLRGNSLIIVPDKQLNYIPFEALIFDSVYNPTLPDYGLLPYLIHRYNIRYAYSIHLYDYQQQNTSPVSKGVCAFAPSYGNDAKESANNRSAVYRSQLAPLPGAMDEAREVVKILGGHVFKDKFATESHFKKITRQGYILHLAMHTLVDDENPMYSKLAFSAENDSINDGFLNAFEIYGIRFSTPLVVLSACNTGYGKMMQGEGLYSLTRGFIYGGCPSMLFTLWQISDKPSKSLMQYFYQHIKQGENIDIALRNAKIQYLLTTNSSMAHPYFWAAYCSTGKNEPISFLKGYHQRIWILSMVILSLCIFIIMYRGRQNTPPV